MKFMTKTRLALLATVASAILIQPAFAAVDAQKFVDQVVAAYGAMGYTIQPGAATADGDNVVVKGVKIGLANAAADSQPLDIPTDITFTNVAQNDDGSYTADSVTMPDVEHDIEDPKVPGHVSLKNIKLEGLWVPPAGKPSFLNSLQMVASISAGPLEVTAKGSPVLSIDTIAAENTFEPEQGSADLKNVTSTFDLDGFKADLTMVNETEPAAAAVITELGLTKATGNINESMSWDMTDGHIIIDNFTVNVDDKGALSFLADVTGFTPAVMDQLYAAQAAAMNKGTKTQEQIDQENGMMAMQMMQSITINSASLRYDDASLANSLIDYFAKQQGTDHAQFVAGLKAMAPMMLAGVNIPALNDIVVPAVNTFLDDPQSIEVAVAPPSPTSLLVLAGAAANPAGLISALGLTVTPNQPGADDSAD